MYTRLDSNLLYNRGWFRIPNLPASQELGLQQRQMTVSATQTILNVTDTMRELCKSNHAYHLYYRLMSN